MDGRGRLALPLTRAGDGGGPAGKAVTSSPGANARGWLGAGARALRRISRPVRSSFIGICGLPRPRHGGMVRAAVFLGGSIGSGAVKGGHVPVIIDTLVDAREAMANAAGF